MIRKYKLFEQNLEVNEELSNLLDMAIETDELELVKFFVNKGARSTNNTLEIASWTEDIFRYLLDNKYKLKLSTSRLNELDVQKTLIDYNKHKYILENLGYFSRRLKNDEKYKESVDNFFKEQVRPSFKALEWSKDDKILFKYFLSKDAKYEELTKEILREPEVQKALIDFGKDKFVRDIGFNSELRNDPNYKKWLDMDEEIDKFNL